MCTRAIRISCWRTPRSRHAFARTPRGAGSAPSASVVFSRPTRCSWADRRSAWARLPSRLPDCCTPGSRGDDERGSWAHGTMTHRFWVLASLALVVLAILGVAIGAVPVAPTAIWPALLGEGDPTIVAIVRTLRLPRVAAAALVGAALAMSGAALQGALRNALAEPYLLGVSGGAAVGAVIAVALGPAGSSFISLAAFAGAVVAVAVVVLV